MFSIVSLNAHFSFHLIYFILFYNETCYAYREKRYNFKFLFILTGASNKPPARPVRNKAPYKCAVAVEKWNRSHATKKGRFTTCMARLRPSGVVTMPETAQPIGTTIRFIEPAIHSTSMFSGIILYAQKRSVIQYIQISYVCMCFYSTITTKCLSRICDHDR